MSGIGLFFAMGSMGLPGLGDFVGEFLVLLGTYRAGYTGLTVAATIGVLVSTLYALKFIQGAYHGPNVHNWSIRDLVPREVLIYVPMIVILLWLGMYPQPIIRTFQPAMQNLQHYSSASLQASHR
jgi:NADH-quinone oxidoreductase subunit M